MFKQPIYFLKFINHYCNFILKINDIELYIEKDNGNISTSFPINEYLHKDENIVTVEVFPMKGQSQINDRTTIELTLDVASVGNLAGRINILSTTTPNFAAYSSESKALPPAYTWANPLKITVPFDTQSLYKLATLTPNEKLLNELVILHNHIYNLFKQKDIDGILDQFRLRNQDKAVARFQTLAQSERELISDLDSTFEDAGNKLLDLDINVFGIKSEYGNKLFSLVDEFNEPPIIYYNESANMAVHYPIRLGKINGQNKLSVIR